MNPYRKAMQSLMVLGSLALAGGCMVSPYDPGYGARPGEGYEDRYEPPNGGYATAIDLTGHWALSTQGVNRFSRTHDGYYVAPLNGRAVHYVEVGPGLYQDASGPGTYEVIDANTLVWYSNNQKGQVIELYRQ